MSTADYADVVGDVLGQLSERVGGFSLVEDDRLAAVAPGPDGRIERDRPEEGEVLVVGERLAAAAPEDVVSTAAVGTPELGHVFGNSQHGRFVLAEHPEAFDRVVEGDLLGRGDDDRAGQREGLEDGELGIAGSRREIEDEVVELAQSTSSTSWVRILWTIGPRQITGSSSPTRKSMLISFIP